ncbi:hypothetical protein CC1G_14445 [Coprinopsis cinerea okayama7|uniref:Uncharacterized protein n=1 Tax=Coprinopsis cinerea (strain Okayama-7 / 130 / ATCC MYA-4618 / FGSC 9003) TaxID=240176 RepID=D6RLU0_COPC7|nr:hypothetical protein CC1G_14445 [Coprinopsis cinerea okayama7\|eukprot:XP_002911448.1 hypothetical protein CC1G_14445 [Coprinopsis cinerea okayama7\
MKENNGRRASLAAATNDLCVPHRHAASSLVIINRAQAVSPLPVVAQVPSPFTQLPAPLPGSVA